MSQLKRYADYKDSGVPWLGEIPSHWDLIKLSRLFNIKAGGDLKPEFFSYEKSQECSFPIYTNSNKPFEVYGYSSKSFFEPDSITVSGRGYIGYAVYRDHAFDAIIRLLVLMPYQKLDGRFYAYVINNVLDFTENSSAVAQLSTQQIAPYKVPKLDFEEQKSIADYLDKINNKIKNVIFKQEQLIEKLAEQRIALITHVLTKGLNPDVEMEDSGVEWLGKIPKEWRVIPIRYVTNYVGSGKTPRGGAEVYVDAGTMLLRSQNVHDEGLRLDDVVFITDKAHNNQANTEVQPNDVLLNITGASLGRVTIFPSQMPKANVNQHVCILRSSAEEIHPQYLKFSFQSTYFKTLVKAGENGSSREGLNFQQIKAMKLPLPNLNEQVEIVSFIAEELVKIDKMSESVLAIIDRLKEYRSALISQAVTGKIDVRQMTTNSNQSLTSQGVA